MVRLIHSIVDILMLMQLYGISQIDLYSILHGVRINQIFLVSIIILFFDLFLHRIRLGQLPIEQNLFFLYIQYI